MNCKVIKFLIGIIFLSFVASHAVAQHATDKMDSTYSVDHGYTQDSTDDQLDSTYAAEEDSFDDIVDTPEDTSLTKTDFHSGDDTLRKWKNSSDFAYINYLDSLLKKEKDLHADTASIDGATGKKRSRRVANVKSSGSFLNSAPLQIFFWAVAIFFIGFIIYKLFFTNGFFMKTNKRISDEPGEIEPEGLSEYSEYDNLIRHAEMSKDYNLSTRYLYLQTLKKLADRQLILYAPDKTNYSYLRELANHNYRHDFATLTVNYEYVWYGKFNLSPERYGQLKNQFNSFNKTL